jgi:hypothetical protein
MGSVPVASLGDGVGVGPPKWNGVGLGVCAGSVVGPGTPWLIVLQPVLPWAAVHELPPPVPQDAPLPEEPLAEHESPLWVVLPLLPLLPPLFVLLLHEPPCWAVHEALVRTRPEQPIAMSPMEMTAARRPFMTRIFPQWPPSMPGNSDLRFYTPLTQRPASLRVLNAPTPASNPPSVGSAA